MPTELWWMAPFTMFWASLIWRDTKALSSPRSRRLSISVSRRRTRMPVSSRTTPPWRNSRSCWQP
nr:MAG TPA: hypothetical protein [Caudoviricetes sp.]